MRSFILLICAALLVFACTSMPIDEISVPDEFAYEPHIQDDLFLVSSASHESSNIFKSLRSRAFDAMVDKIIEFAEIEESDFLREFLIELITSDKGYIEESKINSDIYLSLSLPVKLYEDFLETAERIASYAGLLAKFESSDDILTDYVQEYDYLNRVYESELYDSRLKSIERKVHNEIRNAQDYVSIELHNRRLIISLDRPLGAVQAEISVSVGPGFTRMYNIELDGSRQLPEFPPDVYGDISISINLQHDFIVYKASDRVFYKDNSKQLSFDYTGASILLLARDQDNAGTDLQENKSSGIAYSRLLEEGFKPELEGESGFKGQLIINLVGKIDSFEESDDYYIVSVSGRVTVFSVVESDFIADFELKARSIGQSVEAAIDGAFSRFGEKAADRAVESIRSHSLTKRGE